MSLARTRWINVALFAAIGALLLMLTGQVFAATTLLQAPLHINVGGFAFTDAEGNTWLPDREFTDEVGYGYVEFDDSASESLWDSFVAVAGTPGDRPYNSVRRGMDAYTVNVPNGTYDLTLHFVALSQDAPVIGSRVFDVFVEGSRSVDDLDVYVAVGVNTAHAVLVSGITVTDSQLKMVFLASSGLAQLAGLGFVPVVVEPASTPVPTPTSTPSPTPVVVVAAPSSVVRINVGGADFVDAVGDIWLADREFDPAVGWGYIDDGDNASVDSRVKNVYLDIASTTDDLLFATARNAVDRYDFILETGFYAIDLLFNEQSLTVAPGDRVFDVRAQGMVVLDDFDIVAAAGAPDTAYVETLEAIAVGGDRLTLQFLPASGTPDAELVFDQRSQISGIRVRKVVPDAPTPAPSPTPGPTTTPAAPTSTPPAFGPIGAPTSTPQPTATLTPVPQPVSDGPATIAPSPTSTAAQTGGGGVVAQGGAFGRAVVGLHTELIDVPRDKPLVVNVTLDAAQTVAGFTLVLAVADAFKIDSVDAAPWLADAGFEGTRRIDRERGTISFGGGFPGPVEPTGATVLTVTLTPKPGVRAGAHPITLSHVLVRGADSAPLVASLPAPLAVLIALDETIDANQDGALDIDDVALIAIAYGSSIGEDDYDARADLNRDGIVDLRDLAILGAAL